MEQIRWDTGISAAVPYLLNQYNLQSHSEAVQGKALHKKSGTTSAAPKLKWPNESFILTLLGRKPSYDNMTLAQWGAGQPNNMTQIEDPVILRQVLT